VAESGNAEVVEESGNAGVEESGNAGAGNVEVAETRGADPKAGDQPRDA